MKRPGLACGITHAQAQFRREARGPDLSGAKRDGLQNGALPYRDALRAPAMRIAQVGLQQCVQPCQQRLIKRCQPMAVKTGGQNQRKKLGGIHRFRRSWQNFQPQALRQFAHKRAARGETKVGQQRRAVNRLHKSLPPGLDPQRHARPGVHGIKEQGNPRDRCSG